MTSTFDMEIRLSLVTNGGIKVMILLISGFITTSIEIATAENDSDYLDQLFENIKQNIDQDEECEDKSECKQAAENSLIFCQAINKPCIFMTNDFVPFQIATPK